MTDTESAEGGQGLAMLQNNKDRFKALIMIAQRYFICDNDLH